MNETMTEALKYTDEKPTEPGWYWFKMSAAAEKGWIHQVRRDTEGRLFINAFNEVVYTDYLPGLFAGPIPEPEED